MEYRRFATFNIAGGIGWVASMTLGGYFLGSIFPDLGKHVEKVIIVIVVLSVLPMVIEYVKAKMRARAASNAG
jgi:membrane-associated protein